MDPKQSGFGLQLHSDPILNFWEKPDTDPDPVCMIWCECKVYVCKSMAEMGMEPHPESKIWRLTGFRAGSGVLVFKSIIGINFSDSAHIWTEDVLLAKRL